MALPIGFFMPLPLAMMIPFMGVQSAVMAKQFGENFQYGKRRISAMSNEEFNRLTPKILMENANVELKSMIPSMEASITEMRTFQTFLIQEFIKMIKEAIGAGIGELVGGIDVGDSDKQYWEHFMHGHRGSKAHQQQFLEKELQREVNKREQEIITTSKEGPSSILFGKAIDSSIEKARLARIKAGQVGVDIAKKQPGFADTGTKFINLRIVKLSSGYRTNVSIKTHMTLNAFSNLIRAYRLALKGKIGIPRNNLLNAISLLINMRKRLWNV